MKDQTISLIRKLQHTKVFLILVLIAGMIVNLVVFFYFYQSQQTEMCSAEEQLEMLEHEIQRLELLPDGKRISPAEATSLLKQAPVEPDMTNILIPLSKAEKKTGATIEHIAAAESVAKETKDLLEQQRYRLELGGSYDQIMDFIREISSFDVITAVDKITLQRLSANDDGVEQMMAELSLVTFHAAQFEKYVQQDE